MDGVADYFIIVHPLEYSSVGQYRYDGWVNLCIVFSAG